MKFAVPFYCQMAAAFTVDSEAVHTPCSLACRLYRSPPIVRCRIDRSLDGAVKMPMTCMAAYTCAAAAAVFTHCHCRLSYSFEDWFCSTQLALRSRASCRSVFYRCSNKEAVVERTADGVMHRITNGLLEASPK